MPGYYPFTGHVATRFGDLDLFSHVNNVATASLLEEGRSQYLTWLQAGAEPPLQRPLRMIAEVRIRYLAQIYHPAQLAVGGRIGQVNTRSFRLEQALFQDGRCLTLCDTVYVHTDGQHAVPIEPGWHARLTAQLPLAP